MDEETLEEIQQKYEQSIIDAKEARRLQGEVKKSLDIAQRNFEISTANLTTALENINKRRVEYEDALYEFWKETNN